MEISASPMFETTPLHFTISEKADFIPGNNFCVKCPLAEE